MELLKSQFAAKINADLREFFQNIVWDFRGESDGRKFIFVPTEPKFGKESPGKVVLDVDAHTSSLDVRHIAKSMLSGNMQNVSEVHQKINCLVSTQTEKFETSIFISQEIMVIFAETPILIEAQNVLDVKFLSALHFNIRTKAGVNYEIQLDAQSRSLQQFIGQHNVSADIEALIQQWYSGACSNLQLLIQLNKNDHLSGIILPHLFDPDEMLNMKLTEQKILKRETNDQEKARLYQYSYIESEENIIGRDLRFFVDNELVLSDQYIHGKISKADFKSFIDYLVVLESAAIRCNLHHWIELAFGIKSVMTEKMSTSLKLTRPNVTLNKELEPCLNVFSIKQKIFLNTYNDYFVQEQFIFCLLNEKWLVYNLLKNEKPVQIKGLQTDTKHRLFSWQDKCYYWQQSEECVVSIFSIDGDLAHKFQLPVRTTKFWSCNKHLYFQAENQILAFPKSKLFSDSSYFIIKTTLNDQILSVSEFQFDFCYIFIQQSGKTLIYSNQTLLHEINQDMLPDQFKLSQFQHPNKLQQTLKIVQNSSEVSELQSSEMSSVNLLALEQSNEKRVLLTKDEDEKFSGCLIFELRQLQIEKAAAQAKGHTDAFVCEKFYVRGIKLQEIK